MENTKATARATNLRISPQKLNLVAKSIRGKGIKKAIDNLAFSRKRRWCSKSLPFQQKYVFLQKPIGTTRWYHEIPKGSLQRVLVEPWKFLQNRVQKNERKMREKTRWRRPKAAASVFFGRPKAAPLIFCHSILWSKVKGGGFDLSGNIKCPKIGPNPSRNGEVEPGGCL